MINIVALDAHTLNPGDLNWDKMDKLSHFTAYAQTSESELIERAKSADILIVNKVLLTKEILQQLPRLKYICVSATGYNNIDTGFCKTKKILVSNVRGYSTPAVVQHVFALLFALTNRVETYDVEVKNGAWSQQEYFSYWNFPISEIFGKVMGIYGFGKIGQAVAKVALAFGMEVIAHHKHPERDRMEGVKFVEEATLFSESDVLTLHAPLTPQTEGVICKKNLEKMKPTAFLLNTGRGDLVNEKDLKNALENEVIAGAALDVLSAEPPLPDHILFDAKNCIITPHQAWASLESRQRLMDELVKNVEGFFSGKMRNLV